MDQIRIIKKYPNRRLYDTTISSYITLDEIKELVLKHIKFKIIDKNTDEDMTDYVLLQIITEKESMGSPIFTTEILQNIIRFYGNPLQKWMSQFLENSFSTLFEQQAHFQKNFKENPFNVMTELVQKNMAIWQANFDQYCSNNSVNTTKTSKKSKGKVK